MSCGKLKWSIITGINLMKYLQNKGQIEILRQNVLNGQDVSEFLASNVVNAFAGFVLADDAKKFTSSLIQYLEGKAGIFKEKKEVKIKADTLPDLLTAKYAEKQTIAKTETEEGEVVNEPEGDTPNISQKEKFRVAKDFLFKVNPAAESSAIKSFNRNFVRRAVVDFTQVQDPNNPKITRGRFIDSDITLNQAILNYKQELFNKIVNYLKQISPTTLAQLQDQLYIPDGNVNVLNSSYDDIMENLMVSVIQDKKDNGEHDDLIKIGWKKAYRRDNNPNGGFDTSGTEYYDAVQAWFILKNFDSLIKQEFGDTIHIDKALTGVETWTDDKDNYKYSFDISKLGRIKGWMDDDKRNGFLESGKFSQKVLSAIPVRSWKGNHEIKLNKSIDQIRMTEAFAKMMNAVIRGKIVETSASVGYDTANNVFIKAILALHGNAKENIYNILRILFQEQNNFAQKFVEQHILSDAEMDILYSLWRHVYSNDNYNVKDSLIKMENMSIGKYFTPRRYSLSECITGLIDRVASVNYLNTQYNEKTGKLTISIRKKYRDNNRVFAIREQINEKTRHNNNKEELAKLYETSSEKGLILGNIEALTKKQKNDLLEFIKPYHPIIEENSITIDSIPMDDITKKFSNLTTTEVFVTTVKLNDTNSIQIVSDRDGIFEGKSPNSVYFRTGDTSYNINQYFQDIDLLNSAKFVENTNRLLDKDKDYYELIKFFEEFLSQNFLSESGINTLFVYNANNSNYLADLTTAAAKVSIINGIYNEYEKSDKSENLPNFIIHNYRDLFKSLGNLNKSTGQIDLNTENIGNYFYEFGEGYYILDAIQRDEDWLDDLSEALSLSDGETTKSTSKNLANNSEQNGRTSFLGAQIQYYIQKSINRRVEHDLPAIRKFGEDGDFQKTASANLLCSQVGADDRNVNRFLIRRVVLNSDLKTAKRKVQAVKKLKTGELLINNIFHNFYGAYYSDKENKNTLNGSYLIQPTTYSDKSAIITFEIAGDKQFIINGQSYTLRNVKDEDIPIILANTLGKYYKDIAHNVLRDYKHVLSRMVDSAGNLRFQASMISNIKTLQDLQVFLTNNIITKWDLISTAQQLNIRIQEDTHYTTSKDYSGVRVNPILLHYVTEMYEPDQLVKRLAKEKINFINSIINSGTYFSLQDTSISSAIDLFFGTGKDSQRSEWIKDGYMVIAQVDRGNGVEKIIQGSEIPSNAKVVLNPLLNHFFNVYSIMAPNLRLQLTGASIAHPTFKSGVGTTYLKTETLKQFGIDGVQADKIVTNPDAFRMAILERATKMKLPLNAAQIDAIDFSDISNFKQSINILPKQTRSYFQKAFDIAFTRLEGIAGAEGVQLKRNVIIPATLQYVQQGSIYGVPRKIKVAVIEDFKAYVNTFNGLDGMQKTIDSQDGSAFINPFISILENKALQDQAVGIDKKPIWHHYDEAYGTASLLKFATFTITNLRMLQSIGSETSLYNLFKKMTNLQWYTKVDGKKVWNNSKGVAIDLINGRRYGHANDGQDKITKIDFQRDILGNSPLYYGIKGNGYTNYRMIQDLKSNKFDDIAESIYYTVEYQVNSLGEKTSGKTKVYHLFDKDSKHIRVSEDKLTEQYKIGLQNGTYHTINSLFELHAALGGIFSLEKKNGSMVASERSNQVVVNYMNVVSGGQTYVDDSKVGIINQDNYYQPLKEMMISYAANQTAMKNGTSNLNKAEKWRNSESLDWMEMDSDGLGIQQDSDHDADEAKMSEFSQVITALDQGGWAHKYAKQVYTALGRVALDASRIEMKVVEDFLSRSGKNSKKAISDLYDIIGRIILHNWNPTNENADLSAEIINMIRRTFGVKSDDHFLDDLYLSLSEPSIFGQIVPTIISSINRKSIKRKMPGTGLVMAPAYGIYQLYEIDGKKYFYNDLVNKQVKIPASIIAKKTDAFDANSQISVEAIDSQIQEYLKIKQSEIQLQDEANFSYDLGSIVNVYGTVDTEGVQQTILESGQISFSDSFGNTYLLTPNNGVYSINVVLAQGSTLAQQRKLNQAVYNFITSQQEFNGLQLGNKLRKDDILVFNNIKKFFGLESQRGSSIQLDSQAFPNWTRSPEIKDELTGYGLDLWANKVYTPKLTQGTLPHVTIKLDNLYNYYAFQDKEWYKLSKYADIIINAIARDISVLSKLQTNFEDTIKQIAGDKAAQILIDNTDALHLYKFNSIQYQDNIVKPKDLQPTKLTFKFNNSNRRYSYYDIDSVKAAFTGNKVLTNTEIRNVFHNLTNNITTIGGVKGAVSSLQHKLPETIISNIYATRFNLEDTSLADVTEDNIFTPAKIKLSKNKLFDIAFIKTNNEHTYITLSKITRNNSTKQGVFNEVRFSNYRKEREEKDGKVWYNIIALDEDNQDMLEIGKQIVRDDLEVKDLETTDRLGRVKKERVFVDKNTGEQAKGHFSVNGDKIYENLFYIHRYNYIQRNGQERFQNTVYSIDYQLLNKIKESLQIRSKIDTLVSAAVKSIYQLDSYLTATINPNLNKESDYYQLIKGSKVKSYDGVLTSVAENQKTLDFLQEVKTKIENGEDTKDLLTNYLSKFTKQIYNSFLKSLQTTSARIPAQSLQSFMPMNVVGFTGMSQNVAYVSHIQTYLQGSDYDIDKAYMMGYSFDANGIFIKWSPLFKFDTIEELEASTHLAAPSNVTLATIKQGVEVAFDKTYSFKSEESVGQMHDISNYLETIIQLEDNIEANPDDLDSRVNIIKEYANLIDFIDNNTVRRNSSKGLTPVFLYSYNDIEENRANSILQNVQKHEKYVIPLTVRQEALKNASTAKIKIIMGDLHNFNSAHTPISMDSARAAASRAAQRSATMTMMNPATIFEMQAENQTGRNVISIAANGEKAFFTLYYYFTEGLLRDKGNANYQFSKTFSRIQGRWDGKPIEVTKTSLANLNRTTIGDASLEEIDFEVDQMISQLLSAATDNAKELILAKINAGEQFAKIYFYLLVLGFSVNDIAAFMTSPTISLLAKLSENNIFDIYEDNRKPDNVRKLLLEGKYPIYNYLGDKYRKINKILAQLDKARNTYVIKDSDGKTYNIKSLEDFCKLKNQGKITTNFEQFVYTLIQNNKCSEGSGDYRREYTLKLNEKESNALKQLSAFIETTAVKVQDTLDKIIEEDRLINNRRKRINIDQAIEIFESDLQEFGKIWDLSNEMTTLTATYLGTNQGIPTTLDDLLGMINNINQTVQQREKAIGVEFTSRGRPKEADIINAIAKYRADLVVDGKLPNEIKNVISEAYKAGIAGGEFNCETWLNNESYRQLTIDYYNLVKGTFNIFHVIKNHPQYAANFELLKMIMTMITTASAKVRVFLDAQRTYQHKVNYWNNDDNRTLLKSIDKTIIKNFLYGRNFKIPVTPEQKLLKNGVETNQHESEIILDNAEGFANFKYLMENYIFPGLVNGSIKGFNDGQYRDLSSNPLIKGLRRSVHNNVPFYKLDIDMLKRTDTPENNFKYQDFVDGLKELQNWYIEGASYSTSDQQIMPMSIVDAIVLYNFIVNHNQYGSDRFTTIFKSIMDTKNKDLMFQYVEYVGQLDFGYDKNGNQIQLSDIIRTDDLMLEIAPVVTQYQKQFQKAPFIKVREKGLIKIYEKVGDDYELYNVFAENGSDLAVNYTDDSQYRNFQQYYANSLYSVHQDGLKLLTNRLRSKDTDKIKSALRSFITKGYLRIYKKCD